MFNRDDLINIFERICNGSQTEEDITKLRQSLTVDGNVVQFVSQDGKFNTNIEQITGGNFHFGDIYHGADVETIKNVILGILPEIINSYLPPNLPLQTRSESVVETSYSKIQSPPPNTTIFEFEIVTVDPQEREKRSCKQVEYFIETLSDLVVLEMVSIPGGKFSMGASKDEEASQEDERPQHIVNIKSFFIGRYPITQAQWRVVANLPHINRHLKPEASYFKGDKLPIERVSWYDAHEFCERLSHKTGRKYRLPTEAEWEYACRARTSTPFYFGTRITTNLANYGGQNDNINNIYSQQTTEVGSFPANDFGLCDMHGLVWEWCADWEHEDYLGAPSDGSAWVNDGNEEYRILRGGSWDSSPKLCRSASRFSGNPSVPKKEFGFRVVFSYEDV